MLQSSTKITKLLQITVLQIFTVILEVDKTISLLQFEVWLEKKLKQYYNPIANLLANRGKRRQKKYVGNNIIRKNQVNSDPKKNR